MPTTFSPPDLDRPRRLDEGDNGSGRRPPTDRRTGGNGDGDGDDWGAQPQGKRGPRERLNRARAGIFSVLFADVIAFTVLVGAFLVTKNSTHINAHNESVSNWYRIEVPSILWLNTAVLLFSSATAELARRSMFREHDVMDEWIGLGRPTSRRATAWLITTLLLGLFFLAGQWAAWSQLAAQHVYFHANPNRKFFYIITATHAAHLFLGIAALVFALTALRHSRQMATRQVTVDTTVWYWHAMGVLWIFLFLLLEYGQ